MTKNKKRFDWNGFLLETDSLMSGKFIYLFIGVLALSVVLFFACWGITYFFSGWTPGEAFIQLTNPSRFHGPAELDPGEKEWIAIVVTNLFGLFFINGIVLTVFVNWVSNRRQRHTDGEARYPHVHKKRYAVVIGGHNMIGTLANSLILKDDIDYVIVQTQRRANAVRREIQAAVTDRNLAQKVIIYAGERTSWHELEQLHLDQAKEIYIIGEPKDIDRESHDAINMQCWNEITRHINLPREVRIPCHVMFEYQSTFSAFQHTDLKLEQSLTFRFIPFSIYETWVQQVLIGKNIPGKMSYIPLDGWSGLPYTSRQRVHLIVVGMSKMGMALAIEAAHIAHYPNFNNKQTGRPRTLITMIDRNARREMTFMMGRFRQLFQLARWRYVKAPDELIPPSDDSWKIYDTSRDIADRSNAKYPWHNPLEDMELESPYFGNYLGEDLIDIDFEFIEGDVALPSIQKYIADASADNSGIARESGSGQEDDTSGESKTTIAICLPVANEAMSAALYLEPNVYSNAQQILVQQPDSGALVNAIREGLTGEDTSRYKILKPFGMTDRCDYLSRIHSIMPKLVAYAYECLPDSSLAIKYREATSLSEFVEEVENNWLKISHDGGKSAIAKRWSNIYCANSLDTKIRCAGIDPTSDEELQDEDVIRQIAEVEHNRWVMEQLLLGIRPVGRNFASRLPIDDDWMRSKLKSHNIHPDLISNQMLGKTRIYDTAIAKSLPLINHIATQLKQKQDNDKLYQTYGKE